MPYEFQMLKKKMEKKVYIISDNEKVSKEIYLNDLRDRIRYKLKQHIGSDNAINFNELFSYVLGLNPFEINSYKRYYYWNVIKKLISKMRTEGDIFIIIRRNKIFVLKTEEELKLLKIKVKSLIKGLNNLEFVAEDWVKNKRYEDLK